VAMNLHQAVRKLRLTTGESQQSFAQHLGLSLRAIANYEKDRVPNGPALYRLAKLARQVGQPDLAKIFSSALYEEFHEALEPMTPEEKAWSDAVLALLRNRDLTDWPTVGRFLVGALERLVKRRGDEEVEDLAAVLLEARYRLINTAERQLEKLARDRQAKTGSSYEKAYSEVLMQSPELYQQYGQQRAEAALGTPFEKSMASSPRNKSGNPK
jgi:transcriptional regulator with XRE-family HTH domain